MRDGNLVASGHNWVEGQGSGERIDKKGDVEEEHFDAMGNKIDAPKKAKVRLACGWPGAQSASAGLGISKFRWRMLTPPCRSSRRPRRAKRRKIAWPGESVVRCVVPDLASGDLVLTAAQEVFTDEE